MIVSGNTIMKRRGSRALFPHDHLLRPIVYLIPNFILPNHLTVLRMILVPVVLYFLLIENFTVGIPLFIATALTDMIDGSLARIRKQITDWGTFFDPVADKMLIGSVVVLIMIRYINPLIAVGMLVVEAMLLVGGWYRRQKGKAGKANIWGKWKMMIQSMGVILVMVAVSTDIDLILNISEGTLILGILFAIVSLLTYSL
jgi:CDP-diacylglycerol---glycerol-3-phosphate 3-phosphatidyltransferase